MAGGGQYIGGRNFTDASLTDKKLSDDRYNLQKVDVAYVNKVDANPDLQGRAQDEAAGTTENGTPLVTKAYVDGSTTLHTGDGGRAKITEVNAADLLRIPLTQKGVANGVASLNASTQIPLTQLPAMSAERPVKAFNASAVTLTENDVSTTATKSLQAAQIQITDPGYAYFVWPFASVLGRCTAQTHGPRRSGGGSYGKLAVLTGGDAVVAGGIATGSFDWSWAHVVPHTPVNGVPGNNTKYTGDMVLTLWLALWSGTSYSFKSTGLSFWALVVPAL